MQTVQAVYENGVFRPTQRVELPEHSIVEFVPKVVERAAGPDESMQAVYQILSRSYDTGESDLAAWHNEDRWEPLERCGGNAKGP